MSTHLPGFQSFSRLFASFCNDQISHQQHKGEKNYSIGCMFNMNYSEVLLVGKLRVYSP